MQTINWDALRSEAAALRDTSTDLLAKHFARRILEALDHYQIRSPARDADGRWGNWMWTGSGGRFYPLDPRPEEVHLNDIVWSLSHINRYGGHASSPYSVLTHSMLVADFAADLLTLKGQIPTARTLLPAHFHDSPEAYIEDVRKPLKPYLWGYSALEEGIARVIGERFHMGDRLANLDPVIKDADLLAAMLEARVLCQDPQDWGFPSLVPELAALLRDDRIVIETPMAARLRFRERIAALGLR